MSFLDSLFSSQQLIGLDIGTSYIKAMELKPSKNKFKLISFHYAATPQGVVEHGRLMNIQPLVPVISDLIQQMKTKTKNVSISLCGEDIIVKQIALPHVTDVKHIATVISGEAEQYIPHNLDNAHLQYHILKNQDHPDMTKALIISAQKDIIFKFIELINHLDMNCSIVDIASFALSNCFTNNYPQIEGDTMVLLNLGSAITNFVVLENKEITFAKDLFFGGDLYNKNLINSMQVSEDEAESLKISTSNDHAVPPDAYRIIQNTHKAITEEIKKNFDFYHARSDKTKIQKLFITGGASLTKNLIPFLQEALQLEVQVINPFSLVSYDQRNFSPEYIAQITPYASVAMGLAMRYVGDDK